MFRVLKGHFQGVTSTIERSAHKHLQEIHLDIHQEKLYSQVDSKNVKYNTDTCQVSDF
jgi:predicted ATP-grasp superfamily ATP-dependent carboligase